MYCVNRHQPAIVESIATKPGVLRMSSDLYARIAAGPARIERGCIAALGYRGVQQLLCCFVLLATAWLISCQISQMRHDPLDDAYITFNYGRNLAEGHGLRFNVADAEPTEGFSSPLHVLISAGIHWLGFDPLRATRGLSVLAFLSIPFAFAAAIASLLKVTYTEVLLAALAVHLGVAQLPETQAHLSWGMETMLYAAVLCWSTAFAVYFAVRCSAAGIAAVACGWLLLLLATLGRFEGGAWATLLLGSIALARPGVAAVHLWRVPRSYVLLLIGFVVLAAAYVIGKRVYFGDWFPNPYYVKVHNAIFGPVASPFPGLRDTSEFLLQRFLPLGVVGLVLARAVGWNSSAIARAAVFLLPSLAMVALYFRTIHETARGFRYEYPYLLPLTGAIALCGAKLWTRSRATFASVAVVGALCVPAMSVSGSNLIDWVRNPLRQATLWTHSELKPDSLGKLGYDLRDTGLGGEATVLLSGAGQVPYFSRFFAIDWFGLNNNYLSGREPRCMDAVWDYIDSFQPDVIYSFLPPATAGCEDRRRDPAFQSPSVQASVHGRGNVLFIYWDTDRVAEMLYREMCYVRDHYEFGAAYELWGDWALIAYVRRDSPHRQRIQEVFAASRRVDRKTDLTEFYVVDPRALGKAAFSRDSIGDPWGGPKGRQEDLRGDKGSELRSHR